MKKKCVFVGCLSIIVWSITACGSALVTESVEAMEPEVLIIRDERVVPMEQRIYTEDDEKILEEVIVEEIVTEEKRFSTSEMVVEEMYVVLASENVEEKIADARVDETDFAVDIDGTTVRLDEEINHLIDKLGEPDCFAETVNNPRVGSEKSYTYDGIVIYTNPENGKDIVSGITYQGEEKTLSGIGIGSTRADIEAAYGIHYIIDPNYITYTYGENATLSFRMKDEECECIELSWE